jgi:hypothetical protein
MWSSGTRLADSTVIAGHETLDNDLPEYMVRTSSRLYVSCTHLLTKVWRSAESRSSFGAKTTPAGSRWPFHANRCSDRQATQSRFSHYGCRDFLGQRSSSQCRRGREEYGHRIPEKSCQVCQSRLVLISHGTYLWPSKRAREERARAAERRQLALEGKHFLQLHRNPVEPCQTASTNRTSGLEDDESDIEELPETDQERRQTMMDSMDTSEANQLKTGTLSDIWGGFIMPKRPLDNDHAAESKATGVNSQRTGNAPKRTPSPPALLQSTVRSELSKSQLKTTASRRKTGARTDSTPSRKNIRCHAPKLNDTRWNST